MHRLIAVICYLVLIAVKYGQCLAGLTTYSSYYAAQVLGGSQSAAELADKYGYQFHGQVGSLDDFYLYSRGNINKRSILPSDGAHINIKEEPQVKWFEQQIHKSRAKRDISNDVFVSKQWYLYSSNGFDHRVVEAWQQGYTGEGVAVTIVDDGIERNHPDLLENYEPSASYDFIDWDDDPLPKYTKRKDNNHGTRCAGEVAMQANNSICGVGIAYNSKIGGIRMLDHSLSDVVEAASLSFNRQVISIYSISWGPDDTGRDVDGPGLLTTKALEDGAKMGRNGLGSIFVWASGNGGTVKDHCSCDGYVTSIYTLSVTSASMTGNLPRYAESCPSVMATTYSAATNGKAVITTDLNNGCSDVHTGTSASAPLAAGICALALQANPLLSWRDLQYIVVKTSRRANLRDVWKKNGAGYYVSHKFGFGLMDAKSMVTTAEDWQPLPEQHVCIVEGSGMPQNITSGDSLYLQIRTNGCAGTSNAVRYIEHVQVKISLYHKRRGNLAITLTSPSGTQSNLLSPRPNDFGKSFQNWPFLTTHSWGETAFGIWRLKVEDRNRYRYFFSPSTSGQMYSWSIVLHGTTSLPTTANPKSENAL
ncbi:furin-1-like [Antedon mediterranea]|uniref:furin-1-like n=1 Tax=Antedon mediterranea TaxID=105859 RepID=UPI003AF42B65